MSDQNIHFLLVEDNDLQRTALAKTLGELGYEVTAVASGEEACDRVEETPEQFDLVLMDMELLGMDGLEVLDFIKKSEKLRRIPVIMCSAFTEMDKIYRCIDLGAHNFLTKPIKISDIKLIVQEIKESTFKDSNVAEANLKSYSHVKNLGKGAYAVVDLVRHKESGELLALKRVNLKPLSRKERESAENEALLLKVLGGPTIIRFVEQFVDNSVLYIIMEYAPKGTLFDLLKEYQNKKIQVPTEQIMKWLAQILISLMIMHSRNILHRDLKTQNLFMVAENHIKIGDMGIAKSLNNSLEMALTFAGTPFTMSPEVLCRQPHGSKTDLWSLGCVLYETITFRRPFEAANLEMLESAVKNADYTPLSDDVDINLRMFVRQLLDKNPATRPSAWQLANNPLIKEYIMSFAAEHDFTDIVQSLFDSEPQKSSSKKNTAIPTIDPFYIASMARNNIELSDKKLGWFGRVEKKTFVGRDLLDFIEREMSYKSDAALQMAHEILGTGLINCVEEESIQFDPSKSYKFREDREDIAKNLIFPWKGTVREPNLICSDLIKLLNSMLQEDLATLKGSPAYNQFLKNLGEINRVEIKSQPVAYKVEFFLNVYQIMLVHQMIEMPESRAGWFSDPSKNFYYDFNGETFTLKEIKHGLLRGNRKPPSSYTRVFSNNDSRNMLPNYNDPRVLIACKDPPCQVGRLFDFNGQADPALEEIVASFCNNEVFINIPGEEFILPSLFKNYLSDFGSNEEIMIQWILKYYRNCSIGYEEITKLIKEQRLFLHYT